MRRLSLLYQILLVNSAIVMLGATAGTAITRRLADRSGLTLIIVFASLGVVLSVAANYALLRFALRPLTDLQRTAERVSAGDLSVRAPRPELDDPAIQHLASAFNAMLDRVQQDTLELELSRHRTSRLTQQVIEVQEEERRRISRELHDDTAQSLATLVIYAEALANALSAEQRPRLQQLRDLADQTLMGVRAIIADLRPSLLDDLGLPAALRSQSQARLESAGIHVDFQLRGTERRLPPAVETALYRVFQEAISNILKHAEASYVEIDLDLSDPLVVRGRIEDNGRGFEPAQVRPDPQSGHGMGLFGMLERISLIGGELIVDSAAGEGTEIRITIPLESVAEEQRL